MAVVGWRIRHKLSLGLALVVGVIALILGGTVQGLASYMAMMKTADSKLAELDDIDEFRRAVAAITAAGSASAPAAEERQLRQRIADARAKLVAYQNRLRDTIERHRDPDRGEQERALVTEMYHALADLGAALERLRRPTVVPADAPRRLGDDPALRAAQNRLAQLGGELRNAIYEDLYRRIDLAKKQYNRSMAVVISTSAIGILSIAGLTRVFYRWIAAPIHQLQRGVNRVGAGDFEQPIELRSGDELEELAGAFNAMTERLRQTYADLNDQVRERGKQLVRSERLAGVGFLAAGVAHEINNPLASIAFCAEALQRRLAESVPDDATAKPTIDKYLQMISQEAFRCKAITQNLLEFSRVGEGKREPADLAGVVQGVLDVVQHLRHGHGKQIVFRPTARPIARVNGQEIKQVVLNLVVNALESMDAGGTLTIGLRAEAGTAELVFRDTGCGMTPEVLEHLYEPFFTRSRTGQGTGLGLSICQRIVTQHGGEIEARSDGPGRGSTFTVRLPMGLTGTRPNREEESRGRTAA